MKILGTIIEIIGPTSVLIKGEGQLPLNEVLSVFAVIENAELAAKHGLQHLHIPKGEIRIVAQQVGNFYIAETFREITESSRVIERPASILAGMFAPEIVREKVTGPPSASLSKPTLLIEFPKQVTIGDCVGKN